MILYGRPGKHPLRVRTSLRPLDLLPGGIETVIHAGSALHETVDRIMLETGLDRLPAVDR